MSGTIFLDTLRRSWRGALYWGLGLGLLGFYIFVVIQDSEMLNQYAQLVGSMPPALMQMFGLESAAALATPEGFISFGFFGYGLLILAVYAVVAGLNITANEEDEGILDVVLSLPISRTRLLLERYAAYALMATLVITISFMGLLLGSMVSPLEVDMGRVLEGSINLIPGTLLMIALTALAATLVRRKSVAIAIASTVIVASYFMDFIGSAVTNQIVDVVRAFSFFTYADSASVMQNGLNAGNVLLLLIVTGALVAGAVWAFDRRDVGL